MRCYDFPQISNGYIKDSDSEFYYGDTARAECFKGYNMIGNNVLTCSDDQTFTGVPTCQDKDECAQGQVLKELKLSVFPTYSTTQISFSALRIVFHLENILD